MEACYWLFPYIGLGLIVGFSAGLLGIGGGGIMVPLLTMIFAAQGFADVQLVHLGLGTSMASIVVTAMSSAYSHQQYVGISGGIWY